MTGFDANQYLEQLETEDDNNIDVAKAAVAIAAKNYEGRNLERYIHHIDKLHASVLKRHQALLKAKADDNLETRLAALKHVIHDEFGYEGDKDSYDSLQNANMIEVIERRKGLPVAISILYLSCAHAMGWDAYGLNFPAHFILRLDQDSERLIMDPFNGCKVLNAPDLRELVKTFLGPDAELSAEYHEPVKRRDVLIRLQNNLKLRLIEMEAYEDALEIVRQMEKIAPYETRFLLDEGVLLAKMGQRQAAIDTLESYLQTDLEWQEKSEIEAFIRELRGTIH